jgi:serine/threonine-protein kinase
VGKEIGDYTIRRCIGEGGMGAVYEAVHRTPGKRAAVKVLSVLRAESPRSEEAVRRFHAEAKALCTLHHGNLVELYLDCRIYRMSSRRET